MPVELDLGPAAEAFRSELRDWIAGHPAPRDAGGRIDLAVWDAMLQEARLICVGWPEEFGGRGLSGIEVAVLNEEFARARLPLINRTMGETLVGPSIILHGTDEQKAFFLPRIIDGTDRYCQGFSEPDAGSDLASLQTRGVVDGDEVVVNGQKVWTSWYWDATFLFCLCRTDPDAPKHEGISYVLIPIRRDDGSPNGVEFRPLKMITGHEHFAETFLDDARAPLRNVIGGLNRGWGVTKTTLGNERGGGATTQHVQFEQEFWALVDALRGIGRTGDPLLRQHLAWAYSHVEIMRFQGLRLLSALAHERDPGPGSSLHKMFWSEYQRRLGEIAVNTLGAPTMVVDTGYALDDWQTLFLGSRSHTIWGGTAEIQRNIVAERVLGLPREPPSNVTPSS